jgi:hypothetical protein
MPIGLFCRGLHDAGARKIFSSLAYKYIDVLILSGFRQCGGALQLPNHNFILRLSLVVSIVIQNIFLINDLLQHGILFYYSAGGT